MKILVLLLLSANLASASDLWMGKLTCIKKGFMFKSKTKAVLSEAVDADGIDRSLNGVPAECKMAGTKMLCMTPDIAVVLDLSTLKKQVGITLPLGGTAGGYNYYKAKLQKNGDIFSERVRCRGPIDSPASI